jgi:hypothetical protein
MYNLRNYENSYSPNDKFIRHTLVFENGIIIIIIIIVGVVVIFIILLRITEHLVHEPDSNLVPKAHRVLVSWNINLKLNYVSIFLKHYATSRKVATALTFAEKRQKVIKLGEITILLVPERL